MPKNIELMIVLFMFLGVSPQWKSTIPNNNVRDGKKQQDQDSNRGNDTILDKSPIEDLMQSLEQTNCFTNEI